MIQGLFRGNETSSGGIVFERVSDVGDGVVVLGYGLPVLGPANKWYFSQGHGPQHSGVDLNLRKAPRGDVDLGELVFATTRGLVVFAGRAAGNSWGNMVIVASVGRQGLEFWRYAHLRDVSVGVGQSVNQGMLLGTIGKGANDRYWAHLHLDCWRGEMGAAEMWLSPRVEWVDPLVVWREAGFVWEWGSA